MRESPIVRSALLMALIAFVPSLAFAQRGGMGRGGGGGRGSPGGISREAALDVPKQVNPINLLIEHRQALTLSDSQFVKVVAIKRSVDSSNVPLNRRLDSLQTVFKGGGLLFGSPSAARRDSLNEAHAIVQETESALRANISEGRDRAYGLLSTTQLTKAQAYEEAAEKALADEVAAAKPKGRSG